MLFVHLPARLVYAHTMVTGQSTGQSTGHSTGHSTEIGHSVACSSATCLTCVHIVVSPLVTPLTLVSLLFVHLPACLIYVHTMVSPLVSRFFVRPACHVQPRVSPVISCAGQCIRGTAGRWSGEPASVSAGCA